MAHPKLPAGTIHNTAADALKKFGHLECKPSLAVTLVAAGATFLGVQVRWTTALAEGSLKVTLANGPTDITDQLTIDSDAMTATGQVNTGAVGVMVVQATGEFLSQLAPVGTVKLSASGAAYMPY